MHKTGNEIKRRGGFYWTGEDNSEPYVSVTQVIKVIDKPALRYWFGKEVYHAMVVDPELDQKEALAKPYAKSKTAQARGTEIHEFFERYKAGAELPEKFDEDGEYAGYRNALISFLETHNFEPLEHEVQVFNHEERYAGRLDTKAMLNGRKVYLDLKTNKNGALYDETGLQLSAYKHADGEDLPLFGLGLGADGTFTLKEFEDVYDYFLAAKKLWVWKNWDKCISVGYVKEVD